MADLGRFYLGLSAHYVYGASVGVDCGGVVVAVVDFVAHMEFDLKPCNQIQWLFEYVAVVLSSTQYH